MDWEIRIFYTVAEAGSFTQAGDALNLSLFAVSRQIMALVRGHMAALFHRPARGLLLTELADVLHRAARDMVLRPDTTRALLTETSQQPTGEVNMTAGVGVPLPSTKEQSSTAL